MVNKVELIPISEGNGIIVKENEKVIVGRGSSLGCNEKKISRHHAELILKDDNTLWIKPTHTNPVFFRTSNGKTIQLAKDVERELKDGDQIGLLPTTFYFRVCFSTDVNNNKDTNDSDSDSLQEYKKDDRSKSPNDWSPTREYRRSTSNQDAAVFDFDDDIQIEPTPSTPPQRRSLEKKTTTDVIPKPVPSVPILSQISEPSPTSEDLECSISSSNDSPSSSTNDKSRKLPKWMATPTRSPVVKSTTTPTPTPKSSYSRNSSYTASTSAKRHMSFEGDSNTGANECSNMSDIRSPVAPSNETTKSPGKLLTRIPSTKAFDDESDDEIESLTRKSSPPAKKARSSGKRRPPCQFGSSCYRKNPVHRTEQSHPGDSDYDDSKLSTNSDDNSDKPECPFGKSCYRQNPQHKRDFRH